MRGKSGPESSIRSDKGWSAKRAIALTSGGRLLASGDVGGNIHLFRTSTGHRRPPLRGHRARVNALTFSPDGKLLGSVGNDKRAILWNLKSGRDNDGLDLGGSVGHDIEICPDGRLLAVACDDGKVRIWDLGHVAQKPRWVLDTGSPSCVRSLSLGPNGVPLVAGGDDGRIWVWDDVRDHSQGLRVLGCIDWKVHEVALALGRKEVVSASEDRAIRIWPLGGGSPRVLENPSGWVRTVTVTETHIYSGSDDGKVREWDLESASSRDIATYYPFVYSVAASQDGSVLVVVPGGRLIVRHRGGRERTLHEPSHVWSTAATVFPQRNIVVAGAEDGTYVVSGPNHWTMRIPAHETILRSLDAAPRRDQLASGGDDGQVILWNVATGREERKLHKLSSAVQTLAFSPDGRLLAAGDRMGQLTVWNLAERSDPIRQKVFDNWLLGIAWSKDSRTIVTCGDTWVRCFEAATGRQRWQSRPDGQSATLSAITYSDDGSVVAVGDRVGRVHLYDLVQQTWTTTPPGLNKWVRGICAVPGSDDFAVGVGASVFLVGGGSARITELPTDQTSPVLWLSPDDADPSTGRPGRGVVAVFGDGAIQVVPASSDHAEWAEEEAQLWLAAVVTRPRYGLVDNDQPSKADHLGLDADLRTLAHIMAASSTEPPLAVALLGVWGSGKTTFIEHLEKTIRELVEAEERDPTGAFVQNVRYVGFNAWDYSDRTALVGMVIEIFRDLRAQSEVSDELPDIADPETWRERVESARAAVDWQEKVNAERNVLKRLWLRVRGANPLRPGFGRWTGRLARLALPVGVLVVFAALFWSVFAPLSAKAAPGVESGIPWWTVGVALSAVVGAVPAAFVRASEVSRSVDEAVTWAANWIRSKDGDSLNRAKLALAELDPMTRISELLHDATMEEQRSKHRGVIGDLHDQLRALSEALSEAKKRYESDTGDADLPTPPIQRIFMFVDDLDRCEPHQVVDVLQAVHLLQATGLFVVLVAVDPRWLETSLRKHRPEAYESVDVNQSIIHRVGDPLDYLTKIFQIPFALPQDRGGNYLIELADAARARQPRCGPSPAPTHDDVVRRRSEDLQEPGPAPSGALFEEEEASRGSTQDLVPTRRTPELPAEALTVSEEVARYLNSIARYFTNPRSAKRLINLFQTIRIHQIFAASRDIERDPSMYMPIGGLLGLVVGVPSLSEEVLLAGRVAAPGTPIAEVIDGVHRKHVEHMERKGPMGRKAKERHTPLRCDTCRVWDVVKQVISDVAGHHDRRLSVDEFLPWIDLVARFGFHKDLVWHTALSATTGEGVRGGSDGMRK